MDYFLRKSSTTSTIPDLVEPICSKNKVPIHLGRDFVFGTICQDQLIQGDGLGPKGPSTSPFGVSIV